MKRSSFFLFFGLFIQLSGMAQPMHLGDGFPTTNVSYTSLVIDATLSPGDNKIAGVATYKATALVDNISQLILSFGSGSIESVAGDESELDYEIRGDSLLIYLQDNLNTGNEITFSIIWQTESGAGFFSEESAMWTSGLPHSLRNWLPSFDHPVNELSVSASYTIPADWSIIANGNLQSDEIILDSNQRRFRWRVENQIAATSISWFAMPGEFIQSKSGSKTINLLADSTLKNVNYDEILAETDRALQFYEKRLSSGLPFQTLNIVYLPSSFGQPSNFSASTVILFADRPDWKWQLHNGIIAQWIGVERRNASFSRDEELFTALRAAVLAQSDVQNIGIFQSVGIDSVFEFLPGSAAFTHMFRNPDGGLLSQKLPGLMPEFIRAHSGWMTGQRVREWLYEKTGTFFKEIYASEIAGDSASRLIEYNAFYEFNEAASDLKIRFEAVQNASEALLPLTLHLVSLAGTESKEITITGESDEITLKTNPLLDYAILEPKDSLVVVYEEKDEMFWINQLRSDQELHRLSAATALSAGSANPDVQLAIIDVLKTEQSQPVRAKMLQALSALTQGAAGTEQFYLPELNNSEAMVRHSAIKALSAYSGNASVQEAIRRKLRTASSNEYRMLVSTFLAVALAEERSERILSALKENIPVSQKIFWLNEGLNYLQEKEQKEEAFSLIFSHELSFPHVWEVLQMAKQYEVNLNLGPEKWKSLTLHRDPRIRYLAVSYLLAHFNSQNEAILKEVAESEFDSRILKLLQK